MYSVLILQSAPRVPALETAVDESRPIPRPRLRRQLSNIGRRLVARWIRR